MNQADLMFVVLALGVGVGLGISLFEKHGIFGFIGGLIAGIAAVSALLLVIRGVAFIAHRKKKEPAP